jgi:hypothetical protein
VEMNENDDTDKFVNKGRGNKAQRKESFANENVMSKSDLR